MGEAAAYDKDLQPLVDRWTSLYAATDNKHDAAACPVKSSELKTGRGIEVGHIFFFGTKYSEAMGATVQGQDGEATPLQMGSYGIGVSRLAGAIIEASHDDAGIIWPEAVAPFKVGLINVRSDDAASTKAAEALYGEFLKAGVEVLYDDREERPGAKFFQHGFDWHPLCRHRRPQGP